VDLTYFLVAELARSLGFPCKNGAAESPGDFCYNLSFIEMIDVHRPEAMISKRQRAD